MAERVEQELLQLTRRLLESIARRDWAAYTELTDPDLTCFEPEAAGQLVEGLEFHRFYFQLGGGRDAQNTTLAAPRVRVLGDAAVVAYVRLVQRVGPEGAAVTAAFEETRVWQRRGGTWKQVHFHRSAARPG